MMTMAMVLIVTSREDDCVASWLRFLLRACGTLRSQLLLCSLLLPPCGAATALLLLLLFGPRNARPKHLLLSLVLLAAVAGTATATAVPIGGGSIAVCLSQSHILGLQHLLTTTKRNRNRFEADYGRTISDGSVVTST